MSGNSIIAAIISARNSKPADDFASWKTAFQNTASAAASTVECAALSGASTSVPSFAFAAGYQSALRYMFPFIKDRFASLCITEAAGASPSVMETKIEERDGKLFLSGNKSFVTMALESELYIVCAAAGNSPDGKKNIRLVQVEKNSAGVMINRFELPFVREVSHAAIALDSVELHSDSILPGDGYSLYVKPFRTVEDIHLFAAFAGFLFARGLNMDWPDVLLEKIAALFSSLEYAAASGPGIPETIIAVSGIKEIFDSLLKEADAAGISIDPSEIERWQRDSKLFSVAGGVRRKRTGRAWEILRG